MSDGEIFQCDLDRDDAPLCQVCCEGSTVWKIWDSHLRGTSTKRPILSSVHNSLALNDDSDDLDESQSECL